MNDIFNHDSTIRSKRKGKKLIKDMGIKGYGIYIMLCDILSEKANKEMLYDTKSINSISNNIDCSVTELKRVLYNYGLFKEGKKGYFKRG